MGAADKIENSLVGKAHTPPSGLQEEYFSMCLAKQADTQSKMGLNQSQDTAQRTVEQCKTVSELQAIGAIAPPIGQVQARYDTLVKQAAEQGEAATIKNTNDSLLKHIEK